MNNESQTPTVSTTKEQRQALEDIKDHASIVAGLDTRVIRLSNLIERQLNVDYNHFIVPEKRDSSTLAFVSRLNFLKTHPEAQELREKTEQLAELEEELHVALQVFTKTYKVLKEVDRVPEGTNITRAVNLADNFYYLVKDASVN